MSTFHPTTASEAEWNAAFYRLEDYCRALRLVNKAGRGLAVLTVVVLATVFIGIFLAIR
jgi:hypothetical protein